MQILFKFQKLSWSEKKWVLYSLVSLPLVSFSLHRWGYRRCREFLERLSGSATCSVVDDDQFMIQREVIAKSVLRVVAHSPHRANCLERSLVLWWLLRRVGIESVIRFGGRFEDAGFTGHAWVEVGGVVVGDLKDVSSRFLPFEPFAR
jgi:hypothetical protein